MEIVEVSRIGNRTGGVHTGDTVRHRFPLQSTLLNQSNIGEGRHRCSWSTIVVRSNRIRSSRFGNSIRNLANDQLEYRALLLILGFLLPIFFSFLDVKKFLRGGGGREDARETRKRRLGRERKGGERGRGIRRVEKKKKKEKRERNNRERERERCAEEEGQGRREGQERIGIVAAVETRFTVVVEPIDTRQPSRPTAAVAAAGAGGIEAASLDGEARSTALLRIEATH